MSSFAIDDSQLDKHLSTYKKWSTALYEFNITRQKTYLSPELSKHISRIKNKPSTKESLKCKSYLVAHHEIEPAKTNLVAESVNSYGSNSNNIELNVFNECASQNSYNTTHLSGITVNINTETGKITQYQIKTHKNNKSGFSDSDIDKEFNLFAKLTEKQDQIDLKNHDFADDIQRLKNQNQ